MNSLARFFKLGSPGFREGRSASQRADALPFRDSFGRLKQRVFSALALGCLALAFMPGARAQSYSLDWFKVAGGGGTSVAGTYVLRGTFGQADAGVMSVGPYALEGGFWPGIDAGGLRLTIKLIGTEVIVSWPSSLSGVVLEQSPGLAAPNWTVVSQTPANDGAFYSVTLSLSPGSMFYRLAQQLPAPRLAITRSGTSVILSWPSPSTGFALQQTASLTAPNWTGVPAPADNGITKYVTTSPAPGNMFFRLKQ